MDKALSKSLIALLCAAIIAIFVYGYATVKNNPSSDSGIYKSWIETEASILGSNVVMNQNWLLVEYFSEDSIKYKTTLKAPLNGSYINNKIKILYNPENPKEIFINTNKME